MNRYAFLISMFALVFLANGIGISHAGYGEGGEHQCPYSSKGGGEQGSSVSTGDWKSQSNDILDAADKVRASDPALSSRLEQIALSMGKKSSKNSHGSHSHSGDHSGHHH